MKTIKKGKLNLNRETLVELDSRFLSNARGGVGGEGDGGYPQGGGQTDGQNGQASASWFPGCNFSKQGNCVSFALRCGGQ
jgi:hypothetical protein